MILDETSKDEAVRARRQIQGRARVAARKPAQVSPRAGRLDPVWARGQQQGRGRHQAASVGEGRRRNLLRYHRSAEEPMRKLKILEMRTKAPNLREPQCLRAARQAGAGESARACERA